MALTTHEKIRVESGFQSRFIREAFINPTGVSTNTFYVNSDDNTKFVPEFGTGNTIAGISDVQVWLGLSGVYGSSRLNVTAIDIDQGSVRLSIVPPLGASLTINYSSSSIPSNDIEYVRLQAESIISQRLSICYSLPISPVPTSLISLAARLSSALLLTRSYGAGGRDTSDDGYKLYTQLMGDGSLALGTMGENARSMAVNVGEIGLICTPNYQLVDDSGVLIQRDDNTVKGSNTFFAGGRRTGELFDITEEPFRRKDWQSNVDQDQPGSGIVNNNSNGGNFYR